ncbi:MAG: VWA domain-containing protein [Rikenellaceae bacterium]
MQFASPYTLLLLLLIVPMLIYYIYKTRRGGATLTISSTDVFKGVGRTYRYYIRHLPFIFRVAAFSMIVVALARPQSVEHNHSSSTEGIDIVLALDISGSMLARDFEPDRISAAKQVAADFIQDRYGDRIGLVAFAGESFTLSPLTTDQGALQTMIAPLQSGIIEDGTAIGNGLATALNRMRESGAKSKVVILLTDGVNNRGEISPSTAAKIAKDMGVKVYTIGVGSQGEAPYPRIDPYGRVVGYVNAKVEIDEKALREIAELTGGEYFRATNNEKLVQIYEQINQLEKSEVQVEKRTIYTELFLEWVLAAIAFLILEFITKYLILKRLP